MMRMKYIARWSLMRSVSKENIAEHSQMVAIIAHGLAVINNKEFGGNLSSDRAATIALFHECSEVLTGDLPTPIKYFNPQLNVAYKDLESIANDKLLHSLPDNMQAEYEPLIYGEGDPEYRLVKAADKLSAYIKCIEEERLGNEEFIRAKDKIRRELSKMNCPEADYFMNTFISAFSMTLDDISAE